MKNTFSFSPGGLYLFQSYSCGNTCYFESKEEIRLFKYLLAVHLKKYMQLHRITLKIDGYSILIRIKDRRTIISHYKKEREKKKKGLNPNFIAEPWRIISEKIRVIHSVFAKAINKLRGRSGVLVKSRYERLYFENLEEAINYLDKIQFQESSQRNPKYMAIKDHCYISNWLVYKAKKWVKGIKSVRLDKIEVSTLIRTTLLAHGHI